jgi:hypothetical protein
MRARADICFRPRLNRIRLIDWNKFDEVVRDGHASAREDIALLDRSEVAAYH